MTWPWTDITIPALLPPKPVASKPIAPQPVTTKPPAPAPAPQAPLPVGLRFQTCLPFTLAQECRRPNDWSNPLNFSNDPHDSGGETMCGITGKEYAIWLKSQGLPVQDVRNISQAQGTTIYQTSYWLPYCPQLPPGLDLNFFDCDVNEGASQAIRILQVALQVPEDGMWGPQTALAARGIFNPVQVIGAFTDRRKAVYRTFKDYPYFGSDWIRRADTIGQAALKMAGPPK